jgi:DNA replication protein DnaD
LGDLAEKDEEEEEEDEDDDKDEEGDYFERKVSRPLTKEQQEEVKKWGIDPQTCGKHIKHPLNRAYPQLWRINVCTENS